MVALDVTPLVAADSVLTPLQAVVLGAVQGLSELLPISSSAHLYLVPTLLGWPYAGVAFDVALHAGTLVALLVAFFGDWLRLAREIFSRDAQVRTEARTMLGAIIVATVPALVAGRLLGELEERLRSVPLQASMLLIFGIVLWLADRFSGPGRDRRAPGWGAALAIGFSQCLALVPGVSRSGITLTAGRLAQLSRVSAARFSFMIAIPLVLAAVLNTTLLGSRDWMHQMPLSTLGIGVASAAVFGLISIRFFLGLMRRAGLGGFALYRCVVALGLFVWAAKH